MSTMRRVIELLASIDAKLNTLIVMMQGAPDERAAALSRYETESARQSSVVTGRG